MHTYAIKMQFVAAALPMHATPKIEQDCTCSEKVPSLLKKTSIFLEALTANA
jgi:hypothetical protein